MQKKTATVFLALGLSVFTMSCSNKEIINFFVEYRTNDGNKGIVYDADQSSETGYVATEHNKYQTVIWGQNAKPVVAVPKDGFVFDHWEKYTVFVDRTSFVMTLVSLDDGRAAGRCERFVYDNLVLIACFAEASL